MSALRTSDFDGQAISVTVPAVIDFTEAAAALSQELGQTIANIPIEDAQSIDMLANVGLPRGAADFVTHSFGRMREGIASATSDGERKLTSNAPRPFREYVRNLAAYWAK